MSAEQLSFPDPAPVARRSDPATSHAAARSVDRARQSRTQRALLALLNNIGPSTDEEIAAAWADQKVSPSGLRTRRAELVAAGLVTDTGQRRPMSTGRKAIVWQATVPMTGGTYA